MEGSEKAVFRKKSMERISSPEELHDYMRVTSPRLWMLLGAIAALLVGFIAYASTATMENVMPIKVELQSEEIPEADRVEGESDRFTWITAELPVTAKDQVELGMTVRIGEEEGKVSWMAAQSDGSLLLDIVPDHYIPLPDGEYDAELILESVTPISFLWS